MKKTQSSRRLAYKKSKRTISDDLDLSGEFSTFSLNVKSDEYYQSDPGKLSDPTEIAIRKLEDNTNVRATKQNISVNQNFHFSSTEVRNIHAFFISNTFISNAKLRLETIKQMQSNTLRLTSCHLKIIQILHPRFHPKVIRYTLKYKQKNKCVCIHEIMNLIIMKTKIKIKNKSRR